MQQQQQPEEVFDDYSRLVDFERIFINARNIDQNSQFTKACESPELNRYRNILANDSSLVRLTTERYINANHVNIDSNILNRMVITQGPMPSTSEDLIDLIYTHKTCTIFMLCSLIEKNICKCTPYFPITENVHIPYSKYLVWCTEHHQNPTHDLRVLNIKPNAEQGKTNDDKDDNTLQVRHVMVTSWPDFGLISDHDFKIIIDEYFDCFDKNSDDLPLIHCSAGVGRSGVLAIVIMLIKHYEVNQKFDAKLFEELFYRLRHQRSYAIQTIQQLKFSFSFAKKYIEQKFNVKINLEATPKENVQQPADYAPRPPSLSVFDIEYDSDEEEFENDNESACPSIFQTLGDDGSELDERDVKAGTLSDESSNEMYTNVSSKQLQNGEKKEPSVENHQKHKQVETTVKAEIDFDQ